MATSLQAARLHLERAVSIEFDTQRRNKDGSATHDMVALVRSRDRLEERLRIGVNDLARSRAETLHRLVLAGEYRDYETAQHTERVGRDAARLAATLGLSQSFVKLIGEAAPLHDVGKIGIPDSILLKPGKLSADEFATMKEHTVLGSTLLAGSDCELLRLAGQIALTHHERWNGEGYPSGLSGDSIPIAGRIVAVVDAVDAMTHVRPYKSASTFEEALSEISRCSGSHFDPRMVRAFRRLGRHATVGSTEDSDQIFELLTAS
ncbi:MAG TPA: HD domain-containing phosphohydrolase [Solirubrobacteraceae bacterium]